MRKRVVIDGTPDEVKVSCPVWRGGKFGDNLKGLPITIRHDLRRLRTEQPDGGNAVQSPRQPDSPDRLRKPRKGQQQPELADGGACASITGRTEKSPKGQLYRHENRHTSDAHEAAIIFQMGHFI